MEVVVTSLSQDVSFEDGSVTNFVQLRLPSGQIIRAIVGDESAKLLIENLAMHKTGAPARPRPPQPPPQEDEVSNEPFSSPQPRSTETDGEGALVFGGNYETEEEEGAADPPPPWELPPTTPKAPAPQELPQPPPAFLSAEQQAREYREKKLGRRQPNPMGTQNARSVPKDDRGYPILGSNGGVEVESVVGGGDRDEDGIGQV